MSEVSFKNRVVIVTGAGGGIGRRYALDIAARGGAVVVNDLGGAVDGTGSSTSMADQVVEEIHKTGGKAVASYDSVATTEGAENIVATAIQSFGRVDALINNAGNIRPSLLEDSTVEDMESLLAVHLMGSYLMAKAAWPHMKEQQYGRIVFTSSSGGLFGSALHGCYGAAKAGVIGLMNGFSQEGKEYGILCNALMPNALSRMTDKVSEQADKGDMERVAPIIAKIQPAFQPEFNTGLGTYLASEACLETHHIYSSCIGRIARVFIGVTEGWLGTMDSPPTAEDIAGNIAQINDTSRGFCTPDSPMDEIMGVLAQHEGDAS